MTPRGKIMLLLCVFAGIALMLFVVGCNDRGFEPQGTQIRTIRISESQFVPRKYFFLFDPESLPVPIIEPVSLRVYVNDRDHSNDPNLGAQRAQAWLNPEDPDTAAWLPVGDGFPHVGWFHLLTEEDDYQVLNTENFSLPILALRNYLPDNHVVAVSYRQPGAGIGGDVGGFFRVSDSDTLLQLKMIRPARDDWGTVILAESPWAASARLELRNAYSLGIDNLDPDSFDLRIVRDIDGSSDLVNEFGVRTPLIQLLGLDQVNNNSLGFVPDGKVDRLNLTDDGVLFFPDLRPFDPSRVDVAGNPGGRAHSWPSHDGQRPDTLGWTLDAQGQAMRSPAGVRNDETVPEIYDLRHDRLVNGLGEHHIYTLEIRVRTPVP